MAPCLEIQTLGVTEVPGRTLAQPKVGQCDAEPKTTRPQTEMPILATLMPAMHHVRSMARGVAT